eukprot:3868-Heterococcus_DN1.PRE.3
MQCIVYSTRQHGIPEVTYMRVSSRSLRCISGINTMQKARVQRECKLTACTKQSCKETLLLDLTSSCLTITTSTEAINFLHNSELVHTSTSSYHTSDAILHTQTYTQTHTYTRHSHSHSHHFNQFKQLKFMCAAPVLRHAIARTSEHNCYCYCHYTVIAAATATVTATGTATVVACAVVTAAAAAATATSLLLLPLLAITFSYVK